MAEYKSVLSLADRIAVLPWPEDDHFYPFGIMVKRFVLRSGAVRWGVSKSRHEYSGEFLLNKVHRVWQLRHGWGSEKRRLNEETLFDSVEDAYAAAMAEADIVHTNDQAGYEALMVGRQAAMDAAGVTASDYREVYVRPLHIPSLGEDIAFSLFVNPAAFLLLPIIPFWFAAASDHIAWSTYGVLAIKVLCALGGLGSLWMVLGRQHLNFNREGGKRRTLLYFGVCVAWLAVAALLPSPTLPPAAWLLLRCPPVTL